MEVDKKIAEVKPLHVFVWYRSKLNITSTMIRWIIYDNLTFQIYFTRILSKSELEVKGINNLLFYILILFSFF